MTPDASIYSDAVILIGPMKSGKTTVGKLLADRLDCTFTSLDLLEHDYAIEVGFDDDIASVLQAEQGGLARYMYRRQFFSDVVVHFLREHREGVLELGGGHPIAPDDAGQVKINQALQSFRNVVLLLPSADIQESLAILKQRQKPEYREPDLNELFLSGNCYFDLASIVIYSQGKSASETCDEILRALTKV